MLHADWLAMAKHVHRTDFSTVLPSGQIRTWAIVRVIKAETSWTWREGDPPLALCEYEWSALFGGSIDTGRNFLTVPMQLFRCIRVVVNVDGGLL